LFVTDKILKILGTEILGTEQKTAGETGRETGIIRGRSKDGGARMASRVGQEMDQQELGTPRNRLN
jgi:hypothetical protein